MQSQTSHQRKSIIFNDLWPVKLLLWCYCANCFTCSSDKLSAVKENKRKQLKPREINKPSWVFLNMMSSESFGSLNIKLLSSLFSCGCSFIWQLILFSEHLLQLEEQKYGRGASLRARAALDPGLETQPNSGRKHVNPFRPWGYDMWY